MWTKKYKKTHKSAHSKIKLLADSLQSHQEWTHHSYYNRRTLFCSETGLSKNSNHTETSKSIWFASQLAGFNITEAFTEVCLKTDFNSTCQVMKNQFIS